MSHVRPGHEDILASLTVIGAKANLYGQETYFREAWAAINSGARDGAVEFAFRHAGVILRPEAVVARRLGVCSELLRQSGFEPVAMRDFRFDRHMTRALWRYKLNIATLERLEVVDLIQESAPSLFVLVRDISATESIPASVRLTSQKGPSDPRRRESHHIRARLGVENRLLNFLHTSDEPADFVRELAILFDACELESLLADVGAADPSLHDIAQRLYAEQPLHDLRFDASLERIRKAAASAGATADERDQLDKLTGTASAPSNRRWSDLLRIVRSIRLPIDRWDLVTIGAYLVEPDAAERRILGDASCRAWRERASSDGFGDTA